MLQNRQAKKRIRRWTAADEPHLIVRSLAGQFGAGQGTDRHAHPWRQLIYCTAGVMTVWTEQGAWVAPPHWAIWVPAGVAHQTRFSGACSLRTLYLRPEPDDGLPADCAVITVSPLLRELVLRSDVFVTNFLPQARRNAGIDIDDIRAINPDSIYVRGSREPVDCALALLILGEIAQRDAAAFDLPTPVSAAARLAADLMAPDLASEGQAPLANTAALAAAVGLTPRTLERRFLAETGMTLAAWGRQARLLQALRRLAAGASVKTVAKTAGYATDSAFVAAFKAVFGATPGRYFAGGLSHLM